MTKRKNFQPSAPGTNLWFAAVIIGAIGILARFVPMGDLSIYSYWLLLLAFFLLVAGTSYRRV